MPGLSNSDINVVDIDNSSNTPLASSAWFTGQFVDVTGYSSVSVVCLSDVSSQFSGIYIDWSTNGTTADLAPQRFTFDPAATSQDGFRAHATVSARFYRIRYQNNTVAQTSFILSALLRKGTPAGTIRSIDPINTFTTNLDVETVQAVLSGIGRANGEQVQIAVMDDVNSLSEGSFLFVSPRPVFRGNLSRKTTPASLSPVQITNTPHERAVFLSVTNAVLRGNLFLRLNDATGLSTTNYDFKLLPGETWYDPGKFGSAYSGDVYGVWDEVYIHSPDIQLGNALFIVNYYG